MRRSFYMVCSLRTPKQHGQVSAQDERSVSAALL